MRTARPAQVVQFACVLSLLSGCGGPPSNNGPASADDGSPGSTSWAIQSSQDEMTDLGYRRAVARVSGDRHDFEVATTCRDNGDFEYVIRSFNRYGEPAPMREQLTNYGPQFTYWLRIDGGRALPIVNLRPQYSNQVRLVPYGLRNGQSEPERLLAGTRLIARFSMADGEDTIRFDQASPEIRAALAPCLPRSAAQPTDTGQPPAEPSTSGEELPSMGADAPPTSLAGMGASPGMDYADARRALARGGQASPLNVAASARQCDIFQALCSAYPEFIDCSGTGANICRFAYRHRASGRLLIVRTAGEPGNNPGRDIGVESLRWADTDEMALLSRAN